MGDSGFVLSSLCPHTLAATSTWGALCRGGFPLRSFASPSSEKHRLSLICSTANPMHVQSSCPQKFDPINGPSSDPWDRTHRNDSPLPLQVPRPRVARRLSKPRGAGSVPTFSPDSGEQSALRPVSLPLWSAHPENQSAGNRNRFSLLHSLLLAHLVTLPSPMWFRS